MGYPSQVLVVRPLHTPWTVSAVDNIHRPWWYSYPSDVHDLSALNAAIERMRADLLSHSFVPWKFHGMYTFGPRFPSFGPRCESQICSGSKMFSKIPLSGLIAWTFANVPGAKWFSKSLWAISLPRLLPCRRNADS